MDTKHCSDCDQDKSLSKFSKAGSSTRKKADNSGYLSYCKPCRAARTKAWREKNKEKSRRTALEYYYENRDEILRNKREEYEPKERTYDPPEYWDKGIKQCSSCEKEKPLDSFYEINRCKAALTSECKTCSAKRVKKWRRDNPKRAKAIRERDKYNAAVRKSRREARIRGNGYEPYSRLAVYERDNGFCQLCQDPDPIDLSNEYPDPLSFSIDHIQPVSLGGPDIFDNVQTTHLSCNLEKGTDWSGK